MKYLWMIMLIVPLCITAAIYKSVDKNGNLIFSDQPTDNSQQVDLGPAQSYDSTVPQPQLPADQSANGTPATPAKEVNYTTLEITSPAPNSTFWVGGSPITVTANIQPSLQAGDEASLMYDGQPMMPINGPASSLSFTISEYTPGQHTISVVVTSPSQKNKTLKTSGSVAFYVLVRNDGANNITGGGASNTITSGISGSSPITGNPTGNK